MMKIAGSGSTPKCHGSTTLVYITLQRYVQSHTEVSTKTAEVKVFSLLFLLDDRKIRTRIRIRTSDYRIRKAQKLTDLNNACTKDYKDSV
jgi:hypothetical protein